MNRRRALIAGAITAGAWILVLLLRPWLAGLADLYPGALPAHPYFLPGQAVRVWLLGPLGVAATVMALVAPGALLVLAAGAARTAADLGLKGFGAAYLLRWVIHAVAVQSGLRWSAGLFIGTEMVTCLAAWLLLFHRSGRVPGLWTAFDTAVDRRRLVWALVMPAVLVASLAPLIWWQDITADGLEALTSGLSLNDHVIPRFPNASGLMGLGIGMSAMAYPTHWFTTLLGPVEAAARLPAALYAPLLFLVITALIELRTPRRPGPAVELAVVAVLAAFVTTLGFNGSYEPYAADLAAPTAFESLTVLAMAGATLCLWRGETVWFVAFTMLTYFARPTGFLFLPLMALGSIALEPAERAAWLRRIGLAVLACIAFFIAYEKIFIGAAGQGRAGYLSESILQRLQYLRFLDVRRFLFVLLPTGILPALALFAWRRQDRLARALTLFCLLYFAFFYVQAFVALHQFAPLMLFPVVVFWRTMLHGPARRWVAPAALAGALLGMLLAIPPGHELFRAPRPIGQALVYDAGDMLGSYEDYREAWSRRRILESLITSEVEAVNPAEQLSLAPDVLAYYSHRYRPALEAAEYVVQESARPAPPGFVPVADTAGMAAFVRDTVRWQMARRAAPRTDFRSPLFALPQEGMHRFRGVRAGLYDVNLGSLPFLWRFF